MSEFPVPSYSSFYDYVIHELKIHCGFGNIRFQFTFNFFIFKTKPGIKAHVDSYYEYSIDLNISGQWVTSCDQLLICSCTGNGVGTTSDPAIAMYNVFIMLLWYATLKEDIYKTISRFENIPHTSDLIENVL